MTTTPPSPQQAVAENNLLRCPFCGELDDLSVETHDHSRDWETNYVHCPCGAEGPAKGNRNWAIAGWNRRAPQAVSEPPAGVAVALADLLALYDQRIPLRERPETWEAARAALATPTHQAANPQEVQERQQTAGDAGATHQAAEPAPADKLRAEMQTLGYSDTAINAMGDSTTMMQRAIDARKMLMAAQPVPAEAPQAAQQETINQRISNDYLFQFMNENIRLQREVNRLTSELDMSIEIIDQRNAMFSRAYAGIESPHSSLREELQQKCSDWKAYWRASDAHGVQLSMLQAQELLQDAIGVEVELLYSTPNDPSNIRGLDHE